MLFNSFQFLLFFPVVTILYFLIPHRFRWLHLLIASCVFYCAFIPVYILILFFTILIDYWAGIFIERAEGPKRKRFLIISLVANIGVLAVFKYYNFCIENINTILHSLHVTTYSVPFLDIILPLGLSFHTFQAMSYTIEVYRGNQKAEKHFGIYALYVMFYPQLVAGPIERPQNMLHQFHEKHQLNSDNILSGLRQMLWGLFKKVVIADRLALFVSPVFQSPEQYPSINLLLAILFFAYQIYFDFSGYSDIALGSARVMGFNLMRNFNHPFQSKNLTEFWRRWHISLSTWFNDYLFTPISVTYREYGSLAVTIGLLITFFVSGLWHGAGWTFAIFGFLHGAGMVYEFKTKKLRRRFSKKIPSTIYNPISQLLTFSFILFTWIFFRAQTLDGALLYIDRLLSTDLIYSSFKTVRNFGSLSLVVGIVLCALTIAMERFLDPELDWFKERPMYDIVFSTLVMILVISLGIFGQQSFIYFQF